MVAGSELDPRSRGLLKRQAEMGAREQGAFRDQAILSPSLRVLPSPHYLRPASSIMPELSYDEQRRINIAQAHAKLVALGIKPLQPAKKPQKKRKADPSKKRGVSREKSTSDGEENADEPPKKAAKVQREDGKVEGLRRSARNRGKETNYNDNGENATAVARALPQVVSASVLRASMMGVPREVMIRKHDPYVLYSKGFIQRV